jgi:hypothetical protein
LVQVGDCASAGPSRKARTRTASRRSINSPRNPRCPCHQ